MGGKTNRARLTPRMREVLTDLANGRDPYLRLRGRSQYGGMTKTIGALRLRGLADGTSDSIYITDAGRAALTTQHPEGGDQ